MCSVFKVCLGKFEKVCSCYNMIILKKYYYKGNIYFCCLCVDDKNLDCFMDIFSKIGKEGEFFEKINYVIGV